MSKTNGEEKKESFGAKLIVPRLSELAKVLPSDEAAQAFARIVITALNKPPTKQGSKSIKDCTPESILACVFDLAAINLKPATPDGHCWIIPYGNQATVQIGFKGFCELAYRSGNVKLIQADAIRDGDQFRYLKGAGETVKPFVEHVRTIGKGRSKQALLGAWATCELVSGAVTIEVLDSDDVANIKRLARNSDAWAFFEDEMAKKSAVKRLLKLQQLSNMESLKRAIEIDNETTGIVPTIERAYKPTHNLTFKEDEQAIKRTEAIEEKQTEPAAAGTSEGTTTDASADAASTDEPARESCDDQRPF
jgi:recombination protein RecT